jgi:hypothetical protein
MSGGMTTELPEDNGTAGGALLQHKRGLCVTYAWLVRVDRTQAAAVDCGRSAFTGRFLPRYAEAPNSARTRARSVGVSTPGGGASFVVSTAMRSPCQSARSCSSASPSSIGATDSVG